MGKVFVDISVSLDGFIAGPNPDRENPLGEGGMQLHDWGVATRAWREPHGLEGGESGPDSEVIAEAFERAGATVMGRRMFSGGAGPWEDDPVADGWWGDEPPFHMPVFVLTHHSREPLVKEGTTFTFVTDGPQAALDQAREAAGEKDISIAGGAMAIQQYLRAGEIDEIQIHLVPVLLAGGTPLFDQLDGGSLGLEPTRVIDSPAVTHLTYRVKH